MLDCWRVFLRILKEVARSGVAEPTPGRVQVDAGEQGGEHLDALGPGNRQAEAAALESLGPDGQPIAVPIKNLDPITPLVDEDEEMTGERIQRQARSQGGEPVKALAHVGRFGREVDAD